jgi:hypothetical protein
MTWFSEYSASPRRRLASSAIRCPSVDRFAGFSVPSRVSGQRFSLRGASLPSTGSRRARFPDFPGTMKALRLPVRAYPVPYGFGSRLHMLLRVRARRGAPGAAEDRSGPGALGQPVCPSPAVRTWTRTGSLRFPDVPSHTFARLSDPGRTGRTSPLAVLPMLPPGPTRRRLQRTVISGLNPGLRYPLPTLHERRHRHPCKARFRLAGCSLCREGVEPSGTRRKVSGYIRPPFQDLS